MNKLRLGMVMVGLTVGGCAAGPAGVHDSALDSDLPLLTGPVAYWDYSQLNVIAGRGGYGLAFHVDVAVRNDGYRKRVGAVWMAANLPAAATCELAFAGDLGGGYERWGGACRASTNGSANGFTLAVFAEMNGQTYWDNDGGGNYSITPDDRGLYPASPARGVTSFATVERPNTQLNPAAVPALVGAARVWPHAGARSLGVVYSTDGWRTNASAEGTWDVGDRFVFNAPLPSGKAVDYAVVYRTAVGEFWDNNGGQNYSIAIPTQ